MFTFAAARRAKRRVQSCKIVNYRKIMQAIILAAGMGRRLGEYTRDNTKCMVPVNGVRLIDRLLGQLSPLNLQHIIIVVGYKGRELKEYVSEGTATGRRHAAH